MKLPIKKTAMMCSAFALLAGGALVTSDATATTAYDGNQRYYLYDTDNDGYLEEAEYVGYSYNLIDYDNDGYIADDEWDYYTSVWYEPYDDIDYDGSYNFDYYDTDNDGFIDMVEYDKAYDTNLYSAWDSDDDGYLEYSEYNTLTDTYTTYDYDNVYVW